MDSSKAALLEGLDHTPNGMRRALENRCRPRHCRPPQLPPKDRDANVLPEEELEDLLDVGPDGSALHHFCCVAGRKFEK